MARREHPRYETTEWPEYEFKEFPMMVYPGSKDGGKTPDRDPKKPRKYLQTPVVVNNEAELRTALALAPEDVDEATASNSGIGRGTARRMKTADDERAVLLEEADSLGLTVDKSWSIARLQDAIDTKKAEAVV
jgi:hypothetical protein